MTRQILKYLLPLLCGTALISCYGIEEEHYRELAPVTVSGVDEVIYAKATETLRLDGIRIESANDREVACEWAYGKPEGDFPGMADSIYLSDSPTLDYTFNSAGSYVLRLKVDNGESVGFHYYELRVQAGFDEGYLILCNDEEGKGSMAFVKKRSPQEEAEGAPGGLGGPAGDDQPELRIPRPARRSMYSPLRPNRACSSPRATKKGRSTTSTPPRWR